MHGREHRDQLALQDSFLPFGDKLSGDNWGIKLPALNPLDELENDYAAQFYKGFGAPAKPFRTALGVLIVKTRQNLTDEELVEQPKENPYLQFFIGLEVRLPRFRRHRSGVNWQEYRASDGPLFVVDRTEVADR